MDMVKSLLIAGGALLSLFAAPPSSSSYILKSFDFGNGGTTSTSATYNLNGTVGTQADSPQGNGITILRPGEKTTQEANVPAAPTLTNPSSFYNRLRLVLATSGNPSDTKYAIGISSDSFVTTYYVNTDLSIGTTSLTIAKYQTNALWGAGGFNITGLAPNTTYAVKVSAYQGAFSATAFGPASSNVATQPTTISFSLQTTLNGTPPFNVNFSSLTAGTVFSSDANASIGLSSNADFGGGVYVSDTRSGLYSPSKVYTITSATADLSAAASGYGGQAASLTQASGGPLTAVSPYNGTSNNVGNFTTGYQQMLSTAGPITTGTAQLVYKAKTATSTPASTDYGDTTMFVAAMSF